MMKCNQESLILGWQDFYQRTNLISAQDLQEHCKTDQMFVSLMFPFHGMCENKHSSITHAIKIIYMSEDTQHQSMQSMVSYQRRLMPTALVLYF